MPDSSTGGYLAPSSTGGDLNDKALATFLQQVVVGITGIPGNMVRPRWQPEPPNIPDFGTDWAAIGPGTRKRDPFAAVVHSPDSDGTSTVVRNREIDVLASFYGPNAEAKCELLAMGLELPQNREAMQIAGFALISGAGDATVIPTLIKQRWQYRVDLPFRIRQQQKYTYSILTVESAQAVLITEEGTEDTTQEIPMDQGYGLSGYGVNPYGQ